MQARAPFSAYYHQPIPGPPAATHEPRLPPIPEGTQNGNCFFIRRVPNAATLILFLSHSATAYKYTRQRTRQEQPPPHLLLVDLSTGHGPPEPPAGRAAVRSERACFHGEDRRRPGRGFSIGRSAWRLRRWRCSLLSSCSSSSLRTSSCRGWSTRPARRTGRSPCSPSATGAGVGSSTRPWSPSR